jgi:hypothetical protein
MARTPVAFPLAVAVTMLALGPPSQARAQPPPPPEEPPSEQDPGSEAAAPPEAPSELDELRREIEAQREAIARQQEELDALRASVSSEGASSEEDDAELEAILADVESEQAEVETPDPVRIYGFFDVGLQRTWGTSETDVLSASAESTFVLGNLNVYFDLRPVESWRALVEVRFTNLPHGYETAIETPISSYERINTTIVDSSSPGGGFATRRVGAIMMERAHIDWEADERFVLRAGLILTPYGIWNVDHGTPTLISLTFPVFQIVDVWPRQQLGIEALGVFHLLPWEIGYHAWVSNGRTATLVDLTDDKAVGGRLFVRTRRPFPLTIGVSGFFGSQEDQKKVVTDSDPLVVERETLWSYEEQGLAADLSLDVGAFRLRAEVVFRQIFYGEGQRAPRFDFGPAVLLGDAADRRELGAYLLLAYKLPWLGLEPFLFVDFTKWPTPLGDALIIPSIGLNIHFTEATLLKIQYSHARFFDLHEHDTNALGGYVHFVAGRLVMAF